MNEENDLLELDDYSEEPGDSANFTVNDYGETLDSTVVVEEETRTVVLTEDETIVFEKLPEFDIAPANRPRKVYGGMWGQNEIAAVALAALAILAMLLVVFFVVFPAQRELAVSKMQQDQLEADLISAKSKYGSITDTETQVAKLISSVNDFETRFLPAESMGKSDLYGRLNGLIGAYGLINSSGPEYAPLAILDPQRRQQPENERGRDKLMSLFPGVFVTVTVEGPYQNLRRFIREIETSQQFIMISAVELVPADKQKEQQKDQQAQPISETGPIPQDNQRLEDVYRGKMHGETVSLKIEMAAYFRRPNYTPFSTEVSVR